MSRLDPTEFLTLIGVCFVSALLAFLIGFVVYTVNDNNNMKACVQSHQQWIDNNCVKGK